MDTQNYNEYESQNVETQPKKTNGMALASLIVSIVSLLVGCCCIGWIGLIGSIVSLVLGIMANKKEKTGMATAGIVISIIGIVFSIASIVIGIIFADTLEDYLAKAGYTM